MTHRRTRSEHKCFVDPLTSADRLRWPQVNKMRWYWRSISGILVLKIFEKWFELRILNIVNRRVAADDSYNTTQIIYLSVLLWNVKNIFFGKFNLTKWNVNWEKSDKNKVVLFKTAHRKADGFLLNELGSISPPLWLWWKFLVGDEISIWCHLVRVACRFMG